MRIEADLHPTRADRIKIVSPYTAKDLVRKVPGARWSKDDNLWSVPLAWTSCLALRDIFGEGLEVSDPLSKWAWARKRDVIDPAMALREALDAPGDPALYSYQRAGVEFLALVKRALLFDEMGSGKTVQAIRGLHALHERGELNGQILVVCPNTMKMVWKREIETWWPGQKVAVVKGSAAARRKQIESGADWIVVNWESLRAHSRLSSYGSLALRRCVECGGSGTTKQFQCEVHEREFNVIEFGAVIADEAHRAKDPKSLQTRALWAASGDAPIRFALTGTPIANDPTDLWSLLHWADEQEWPTKTAWTERLIDFTFNVWGGMEVNGIKSTHEAEFHATVDPRMRRMPKSVVLPFLPPIVNERRDVEMHPRQKKAYDSMAEHMAALLDAGLLMARSPMVQVGRLLQLASSFGDVQVVRVRVKDKETGLPAVDPDGNPVYRDEEHLVITEPSSKLDAFMSDLADFGDESVIVFAESRQLIELLSERMHKARIRHGLITGAVAEDARNRTIDDFQKGLFKYVLCTIGAGGVGITLTRASTVVFLQRSWSSINMDQAIARAHRIGSEIHESITVIDYVTPDTAEESQIWAVARKLDMLESVVRDDDLLRKLLVGGPLE